MHRSRLSGFVIDCRDADLSAATEFWAAALGCRPHFWEGEERYAALAVKEGDPEIFSASITTAGSISTSKPTTGKPRSCGSRGWAPAS